MNMNTRPGTEGIKRVFLNVPLNYAWLVFLNVIPFKIPSDLAVATCRNAARPASIEVTGAEELRCSARETIIKET